MTERFGAVDISNIIHQLTNLTEQTNGILRWTHEVAQRVVVGTPNVPPTLPIAPMEGLPTKYVVKHGGDLERFEYIKAVLAGTVYPTQRQVMDKPTATNFSANLFNETGSIRRTQVQGVNGWTTVYPDGLVSDCLHPALEDSQTHAAVTSDPQDASEVVLSKGWLSFKFPATLTIGHPKIPVVFSQGAPYVDRAAIDHLINYTVFGDASAKLEARMHAVLTFLLSEIADLAMDVYASSTNPNVYLRYKSIDAPGIPSYWALRYEPSGDERDHRFLRLDAEGLHNFKWEFASWSWIVRLEFYSGLLTFLAAYLERANGRRPSVAALNDYVEELLAKAATPFD